MHEHRTKDGRLIRYMSRAELEGLRGYRPYASGRRGRAACPFHDGQSTDSLAIDWETGWASCWGCGRDAFVIRVEDHPETHRPGTENSPKPSLKRSTAPTRAESPKHDPDIVQDRLEAMLTTCGAAFAGSPGQAYLERRGIPLDVARHLGIGWAAAGPLARRVIFPLCDPDGTPTSATGRAIDDHTRPKYKALSAEDGYRKTLFNGGAITQARRSGHPLVIVEGPIDAAACVAGGLPLAVAIGSTSYAHAEQFAGVTLALLVLDADDAGQQGRRDFAAALMAAGVEVLSLPAAAIDGCKDLGEYWQRRQALPVPLVARAIGPHLTAGTPHSSAFPRARAHESVNFCEWPDLAGAPENHQKTSDSRAPDDDAGRAAWIDAIVARSLWWDAEAARTRSLAFDDLPADLQAEAETLAAELIAGGIDEIGPFWADLERNRDLPAEDRAAARYALDKAIASLPDIDDPDALDVA